MGIFGRRKYEFDDDYGADEKRADEAREDTTRPSSERSTAPSKPTQPKKPKRNISYGIEDAIRFNAPIVRCDWLGDAWEVDPAWDGKIFNSVVQASRPLRKGGLSSELSLPPGVAGPVCVRMVSVRGQRGQVLLPARY